VHYDFSFTNPGGDHFSEEERGMYIWTLFCFLVCSVVGYFTSQRLKRHDSKSPGLLGHFHPVIEALGVALLLHYASMSTLLVHYWGYASDGIGFPFLNYVSIFCHESGKLALTTLFIVISQGWTITSDKIPNRESLVPILGTTTILELIGLVVQYIYADSHDAYSSRSREGGTGFCLILLQVALYCWFLDGVKKCISVESKQMSQRHDFFLAFAFCCSIWFLAEPFLVLLSVLFANYYRQRILVGGGLLIQSVSLCLLARLFLWPSLYFKISTMSESVLPFGRGASTGAPESRKDE